MFNNKTKLVEKNYVGSSFIGHSDFESCLKSLYLDVLLIFVKILYVARRFKENAKEWWTFSTNSELKEPILALVTRLMQTEVVQEHTLAKLIKPEFNDCAHFLPSSSVDIGFAANGVLKKLVTFGHIKCTKEHQFRSNVKTFSKLLSKKSQKNHQLTLHLSSLSATKISSISVELLVKGFKELLETLFNPLFDIC